MKFPCELLAEPYLAQIRRTAARYLHHAGMTQVDIANLLQVSQPLVSNYLKKDPNNAPVVYSQVADIGLTIGKEIGRVLFEEGIRGTQQAIALGCSECKIMRQNGIGCLLHKLATTSLSDNCTSCHSTSNIIDLQLYRGSVIDELNNLFILMSQNSKLHYLIPEIGMQIASGIDNFASLNEIAAFPGRIRKKRRGVLNAEYPTFGSSETLAGLLIKLNTHQDSLTTIAAIKSSEWLIEMCIAKGIPFTTVQKFDEDYEDGISKLYAKNSKLQTPIILYNHGNVGYEDISYILCDNLDQLTHTLNSMSL